MAREDIVKDLECDELCFIGNKEELKEKAKEKQEEKRCPPCFD